MVRGPFFNYRGFVSIGLIREMASPYVEEEQGIYSPASILSCWVTDPKTEEARRR
jgi:hypothetical protein